MDAARTALRIGAASVTVLHREAANDVPALKAEYEAAKQEGVNFLPAVTPLRFMGTNKVLGLQYSISLFKQSPAFIKPSLVFNG